MPSTGLINWLGSVLFAHFMKLHLNLSSSGRFVSSLAVVPLRSFVKPNESFRYNLAFRVDSGFNSGQVGLTFFNRGVLTCHFKTL